MRSASSPAALRVKVSPSTSSRRTMPLATSHTTRPAIVSVLPLPAPATTRAGAIADSMTAACSAVGGNWPRAALIDGRARGRGGHDALTARTVWMRQSP